MYRNSVALFTMLLLAAHVVAQEPSVTEPEKLWEWTPGEIRQMEIMASDLKKRRGFYIIESQHWIVESDVSPRFAVEVACYLDMFANMYQRCAGRAGRFVDDIKPRVTVFRNKRDYDQRAARDSGGHMSYRYRGDELTEVEFFTYAPNPQNDFAQLDRRTLNHEAVHCLLQKAVGPAVPPSWFHEGHAMLFEGWDPRESLEANRDHALKESFYNQQFMAVVKEDRLPRLESLLELRHGGTTWRDKGGGGTMLNYAASQSFMDCLFAMPEALPYYEHIFERVEKNRTRVVTPEELPQLEQLWHRHLKNLLAARDKTAGENGNPTNSASTTP